MNQSLLDIVLLSTADWDNPFWTNKQFVARELARLGHRVLYIDSLGLRAPAAGGRDLARILRRLRRWLAGPRQVVEGLQVLSPLVVPLQRYTVVRWLNRKLLTLSLRRACKRLGMARDMLWTYNPMTTELLDTHAYRQLVYHCVDEIKAQPGMPAAEIERAERELLARATVTFVTSITLLESRSGLTENIHLFENVADFDHFHRATHEDTVVPDEIAHLDGPVVGFVGAISPYKLDFDLLERIAEARPQWQFVMIGQAGEGEPGADVCRLTHHRNMHLLGPRPYAELPAYIKGFDVAIIPAALNEYTHAMFPMKFFEYLAAGKRIVSTPIDSLASYDQRYVSLAHGALAFVAALEQLLASQDHELEARLELARRNTYETRTAGMMGVLDGLGPA